MSAFDRVCMGLMVLMAAIIVIVIVLVVPFGVGSMLFHLTSVFANWAVGASLFVVLLTVAYFVGGKIMDRFGS